QAQSILRQGGKHEAGPLREARAGGRNQVHRVDARRPERRDEDASAGVRGTALRQEAGGVQVRNSLGPGGKLAMPLSRPLLLIYVAGFLRSLGVGLLGVILGVY